MKTYPSQYFPQLIINSLVKDTARKLFHNIAWEPYAVRQNKNVSLSNLDYIDYAVPCFEFSKKTQETPANVAKIISQQLNRSLEVSGSKEIYKIESISGYINFQLSDEFINKSLNQVTEWYSRPYSILPNKSKVNFLIIGAESGIESDMGVTGTTLYYLQQIYKILGLDNNFSLLINDISYEFIESSQKYKNGGSGLKTNTETNSRRDSYIKIKKFLLGKTNQDSSGALFLKNYNSYRIKLMNETIKNMADIGLEEVMLVSEYENIRKTNRYIDNDLRLKTNGVLKDSSNEAAYYSYLHDSVALRSSSGVLFRPAFIMYALDSEVSKCADSGSSLVIIGSHRNNLLVSEMIRSLVNQRKAKVNTVYFDPRVSRADIIELASQINDISKYFETIVSTLSILDLQVKNNLKKRQAILKLIDTPLLINSYLTELRMPAFFDAINQSREAIELLIN